MNIGKNKRENPRNDTQQIAFLLGSCFLLAGLPKAAQAKITLIREWKAAPVLLQNVEFSPNGEQLLTASGGGVAQLWSLEGKPGAIMEGERPPMFNAHFNKLGSKFITTSYNGTISIWNKYGILVKTLAIHKAAVADARFVGNDGSFVSSSDDGQIVMRNGNGSPIWSDIYPGTARQLAVSGQNNLIAGASDSGTLHLVALGNYARPKMVKTVQTPHGRINQLSISGDGEKIAAAGIDGTVTIWSKDGSQLSRVKASSKGWANGGIFCKNKNGPLLTVGDDGVIKEWSEKGKELAVLKLSDSSRLTKVDCSASGKFAAVVGSQGELWLLGITPNP
ncbi:WD40 repeat domain-containing protein [Cyanobium sp. WAJ14-Wanaka]|uniref:WD40 repeat domain-containing protein n=1 Tax=Cyanobium sp. WAJ14-Wanaka TaxID=2823725 RepID=UPI0020CE1B4E|nr:WD40 repeat domain-containing protein [Cyanobium sp. WAJ14-Wanaka]MCP9775897.1 WD40 repeat domain-containing protein [Cyanobium sp. WAJ14-Wanaka]